MSRAAAFVLLAIGGLVMADEQKKDDPEFPERVTFRVNPNTKQQGKGDWADLKARLVTDRQTGEMRWEIIGLTGVPLGPQPGDMVIEKDGTVWEVKRASGGELKALVCKKIKDGKKPDQPTS